MKKTKFKCGETKIKSHSFISKHYDENGKIDKKRVSAAQTLIFIALNILVVFLIYSYYFYKDDIITTINEFIQSTIAIIQDFFINHIMPPQIFIDALIISAIVSLPFVLYFRYKVKQAAAFQAILSSAGLQQYRLIKKKDKKYYLAFNQGTKNAFSTFLLQKDNLSQMLQFENLQFSRWKQNGVIIQASEKFPSIDDLKHLKIQDFIKDKKLFVGIGLPNIGEDYNKKDLILKKYLPRYIEFSDIPNGVANLGSAGGGKSNSMNLYLYSIFYNFNLISQFYFIDYKGGIEAEPILDLEKKYKTGKIKVYDDNRVELYKTLKLLYFINKSRMRYLKANKLKKLTFSYIILLFDELAEVLDFTPNTKEERFLQEKISFYLESLLRTGRSQGLKIIYSTQSYLSNSSGLTSGMKNNTKLKITHQLGSKMQVASIKSVDELNELSIDPTNYDVGKNVVINESDNTIYEVRSLYVEDNFTESIELKNTTNDFEEKMQPYYQQTYDELTKELQNTGEAENEIYPLSDIAVKLGLKINSKAIVDKDDKITDTIIKSKSPNKPKVETPKADKPLKKPNKGTISKTMSKKKSQNTSSNKKEIQDFLKSLQNPYNDENNKDD